MSNPSYPAPSYPAQPGSPAPAGRSLLGMFLALGVVVVLVLIGAAVASLYLANVGPFKDSGLALCESIRDAQNSGNPLEISDEPDSDPNRLSEAEYQDLRSRFAGSRYGDIRDAGTRFVDLTWQLTNVGGANGVAALILGGGQVIQAYSSLSGACANHGVTIPPAFGR